MRALCVKGAAWQIGVNPFTSERSLWYTIPDAVAAVLLTGKVPRIARALVFVPTGSAAGLRPVRIRGEVAVDPAKDDFFRRVIEERKRLGVRADLHPDEKPRLDRFLKVLANATSYGIFAEMNRRELPARRREHVTLYGLEGAIAERTTAPEEPGEFFFGPLAALIAGSARLMLAILERCVTDAGGTYAFCDTDSMAIVASEQGGLVACGGESVRALSWEEVERIRDRFGALNPYDREVVSGSILKVESENFDPSTGERRQLFCYAISARRYALFNFDPDGKPLLRKSSEHGLGHLLNPTDPESDDRDWIRSCWELILSDELGVATSAPTWLDRPALSRFTANTPALLRPLAAYNAGKPYAEQIKPFNFLLSAHVEPFGHPEGYQPKRFHLIAPYESDPRRWLDLPWVDLYSGDAIRITIDTPTGAEGFARVKTYRDVIDAYKVHPEPKSLGPDGKPCCRATRGLLKRRTVTALSISYVGKESNRLEDVQTGLVHRLGDVLSEWGDSSTPVSLVVLVVREMPLRRLEEATGLSRRQLQRMEHGEDRPAAPASIHACHRRICARAAGRSRRRAAEG